MEILSKIGQTLPSVILIVEPPNLNESLNLAMMRFLVPHGEGRKDWEGRERKEKGVSNREREGEVVKYSNLTHWDIYVKL